MKPRTRVQTLDKIKAWEWLLRCFFPRSPWETHRVFLLCCRCSWFERWHLRMLTNSTPWRFWRRRRSKVQQPDYHHGNKTGWQDWRFNTGININVNFFSWKAVLCLSPAWGWNLLFSFCGDISKTQQGVPVSCVFFVRPPKTTVSSFW